MLTPERLAAIKADNEKAQRELFGLVRGFRQWTMSEPPDREHDSDIVLYAPTRNVNELLSEVERLQSELADYQERERDSDRVITNAMKNLRGD